VLEWFDAYVESRLLEAASQNRVDGKVAEIIAKNRLGFDKNATSKDKMTVNIEFVPVSSKADVAVVEGSKEMEDIEAKSIAEVEDIMGKSPEDEMVGLVLDQRGYEHTVDELLKPGMFDKEKPSSSGKDEFDKVLEELM
jgi:hypothetical protein